MVVECNNASQDAQLGFRVESGGFRQALKAQIMMEHFKVLKGTQRKTSRAKQFPTRTMVSVSINYLDQNLFDKC